MGVAVNAILQLPGFQPGYSPSRVRRRQNLPEWLGGEGDQPVALLDQKHIEYAAKFESWLDLTLLYEGGSALKARAERLLKKRPREDEEVYACRLDHFTYQNILGTGLGWYGSALFETEPEIFFNGKEGSEAYAEFLENCDGQETTYIDFFKQCFQYLLTYGRAWVLTDLRALEDGEEPPITAEDEKQRGLLDPHVACYSPLNVINWQTDKSGNMIWAMVRVEDQEQRFLESPEIVTTYYYYDRENFKVWEDRRSPEEQIRVATDDVGRVAKLIKEGRHALAHVKRLPLRCLTLSEGLWLANRAYLLLIDHLNQDNTYKWALLMSNLAMPVVIGDYDASGMTYSEVGYLSFPSGTEYMWSEPEGKSFANSAKRVADLREEAYRMLYLQAQGKSMHATPSMQSGRSKIVEMMPARQTLSSMGDDVRKHMEAVLCDVRDARHEPKVEPDVRGLNFEDDMTTEEVFAAQSVLNMKVPSETFEKYLKKRVAKAWMRDAARTELNKVYKEIDAGPTDEEREQDELRDRMKMAKQNMAASLGGGAGNMPPGRGGAGPAPPKSSEGQGKTKE